MSFTDFQLSDLCHIGSSKRIFAGDYVATGIPFYASKDVIDKALGSYKNSGIYISKDKFIEISNKFGYPKSGDILLSAVGNRSGIAYVIKDEGEFYFKDGNLIWLKNFKSLNSNFLFYWFNSSFGQDSLNSIMIGSAQKALTIVGVSNLKIKVPSLDVQNQIATILGALDDRITLLRETNATLEAIAQALFKSWFVDFDPVHAKMQGSQPEDMDEQTAALFPDSFEESELGLVPAGWEVGLMSDWLSVLETGRRPKGGVSGIDCGIPSIGAESIIRIGQFDYSKVKYVSPEFFAKMKSGILESHDVLLYKDGGKPGVFLPRVSMFGNGFPFDVCGINEHVFRMRLKEPFNQTFLYFWIWSDAVMHELKHRGGKAAIPGINQSDVKEQKLLIPTESVLRKFDDLTAELVNGIFNNVKQAQTLANLRDTLLPRLISGQLRVGGVE